MILHIVISRYSSKHWQPYIQELQTCSGNYYPYKIALGNGPVTNIFYDIGKYLQLPFWTKWICSSLVYTIPSRELQICIHKRMINILFIFGYHGVYISHLILYVRAYSAYDQFLNGGRLLTTNKLMLLVFEHYFDLTCKYNLSLNRMLTYFISIVMPF